MARNVQEALEKKRAAYAEKMKNQVAEIHKAAEEKRAMVVAKREEDALKAEETAAKYRATNQTPKKGFGCFWWPYVQFIKMKEIKVEACIV